MTIVISGNPADGFAYWGPFDDQEAAIAWAESEKLSGDWWVVELANPEATEAT